MTWGCREARVEMQEVVSLAIESRYWAFQVAPDLRCSWLEWSRMAARPARAAAGSAARGSVKVTAAILRYESHSLGWEGADEMTAIWKLDVPYQEADVCDWLVW